MKSKIIGIVITIIGLGLLFGAYILGEQDGERNAKDKKTCDKEEKEDVKKDDDQGIIDKGFDTVYLTYIPSVMRHKLSDSFFVYQSKKVSVDNIDTEILYSSVMNEISYDDITVCQEKDKKAHNNCDILIPSKLLQKKVQEMYGEKYGGKTPKKLVGNGGITCKLVKNYYECMNGDENETYSDYSDYFFYGNEYMNVALFDRYESNGNYVFAYVKFLNIRIEDANNYNINDLNSFNMKVFANTNDNKLIDDTTIHGRDFYSSTDTTTFGTKIMNEYLDKAPVYKHAYRIDSKGNYIWEYTEQVSE